jgi:hypothetical protein
VKHYLKAEPTLGGFALVRVLYGHRCSGMCESRCPGSTNLPDLQGGQQTKDGIWQTTDNCLQQQVSVLDTQIAARHL